MGLLTLALIFDLIVGDPDWIWKRVPHPVVWIGKIIDRFDGWRDREAFRSCSTRLGIAGPDRADMLWGGVLIVILLLISIFLGRLVSSLGSAGQLIEIVLIAVLVAQKSLHDHVLRVVTALNTDGLAGGRKAVSMIVGRDVSNLDESGVCKASIESLAENFSDGVVAPVFWYAVAGLPGLVFYKAVNTADSMIGHRNTRFEYFGKPSAVLDDWMNWPASRLSSVLVACAVALARGRKAARHVKDITLRDAGLHRSPNAGWPEASFAAALGLTLGGPRRYGNDTVAAETLHGEGRDTVKTGDVEKALALYLRCCFILIAVCGLFWLIFG